MKSSEYWKERFTLIEQTQNDQGLQCYEEIERQYRRAMRQLEAQINTWYGRFATNNNVTMQDARRMLSRRELEEFRWDVNDYIRYGKENKLSGEWMKQLENASARYHVSRMEVLKLQMQQNLEVMFGNQLDTIDAAMRDIYINGYYHTAYEIQKGVGIGWNFATLDNRSIGKVINRPWAADGKNFSERIWTNRQKLVSELHTQLSQNIILGQDPQKAIDAIARKMNTSKVNAGRLIMTEKAFFSSAAQQDCFKELGVEQFEIVATLDSHTSDICQEMDGKVFPMSQWEIGVTAPPFHVYCRSTTVPAFGDEFDHVGERAARDQDGETYYVPADMTYKEWQKSFKDGDKTGLQEALQDDIIKANKEAKQVAKELKIENFPQSFAAKAEIENTRLFIEYVNNLKNADKNVVNLFSIMGKLENIESNGITFKISHAKNHSVSYFTYRPSGNLAEVKLTIPKLQGDNLNGQINTILHEEMHLMDLYGRRDSQKPNNWFSASRQPLVDTFLNTSDSMSDDIVKLFTEHDREYEKICTQIDDKYNALIEKLNDSVLSRTFQGTYDDYNKQRNKLIAMWERELNYECRNIQGGGIGNLQDIYDALSGGKFRDSGKVTYGHGSTYYSDSASRIKETVANYAALSITRPDLIDLLRADKPKLVSELDATIIELVKKAGGK